MDANRRSHSDNSNHPDDSHHHQEPIAADLPRMEDLVEDITHTEFAQVKCAEQ